MINDARTASCIFSASDLRARYAGSGSPHKEDDLNHAIGLDGKSSLYNYTALLSREAAR